MKAKFRLSHLSDSLLQRTFITGAVLLFAGAALGASIGLKFGVNGNGGPQTSFLLPSDLAGAPGYEQTNWVTLGRYGDNSTGQFNVVDSGGANTGILLTWDATGAYAVEGSGTATDQGSPSANLMDPYLDSNNTGNVALTNGLANGIYGQAGANKPLIYVSGLTNWLAAQGVAYYDVVIYMDGDNAAGRTGEYWIANASGPYTNITYGSDLTTHVFVRDYNNFHSNPEFQQVPLSSDVGRVAGAGNYTVFTGLSADSFLIRTAEYNTRAPINAVQIVPRASAPGATLAPLNGSKTYAGGTATFRIKANGVVPMTYQWLKNGSPISDGGNIAGTTSRTLSIRGVIAGDAGNYSVIVSNASGQVTSQAAPLEVLTPAPNSYAEKIVTNGAVAYWRFNENGDSSTNNSPAYDLVGGFNGVYGTLAQNPYYGIVGPRPPAFPGFEADNGSLATLYSTTTPLPYPSSYVSWAVMPALNLNTNLATFCAWIYPAGSQVGYAGLIFSRGSGSDISGFGYGNNNNLGYTWNNQAATYNFASGLVPATNQWSFVACVVTPTNAILYLYNTDGQFSATNTPTDGHTNTAFASALMIGDDPNSTTTPQNRAFNGSIDEVAIFPRALSDQELYMIYKKGLNVGIVQASITQQPQSAGYYEGRTATFRAATAGDRPLSYQWRRNGANLANDARISGVNTATLKITGVTMADTGTFDLVVNNIAGVPATSTPATLTVVASNAAPVAYEAALRQANPIAYWRLNEASGASAYDYWGGDIATHTSVQVGVDGPRPPDFAGFEANNTAVSYDGVNSATDTGVSYITNRAQFSIIGWFNSTGTQASRAGLFGQNDSAEFGFHGADLGIWTPNGGFASFAGQGQTFINPGQWYFTAAVGDGSSLTLYLLSTNLAMQTSVNVATTNYGSSTFPFRIGGGGILDATGNYFAGQIDDVAVFDRALSSGEIAKIYGAAQTGGLLPPAVSIQPASATYYAGRNAHLSVAAVGSEPLQFQWRKAGVNLTDSGNISGTTTPMLNFSGLIGDNTGDYDVVVKNSSGSVTSVVARLSVIVPTSSFESVAVSYNPIAYWRLNEQEDPSTGTLLAFDYVGGLNGTYGAAVQNGYNDILGPTPDSGWSQFERTNYAVQTFNNTANAYVTVPALGITTNVISITAWVKPASYISRAGIVFARAGQAATGMNFINNNNLNYHWLDAAATYNWDSLLYVPTNQWSFVALVVEPARAIMYLANASGFSSATNVTTHAVRAFSDTIRIGGDPNSDARTFDGVIDEVSIYPYALTGDQIQTLYRGVPSVELTIKRSGSDILLSWPQGTLLEASQLTGPWTTNNATSPYPVTPTAQQKYYRVLVK